MTGDLGPVSCGDGDVDEGFRAGRDTKVQMYCDIHRLLLQWLSQSGKQWLREIMRCVARTVCSPVPLQTSNVDR